MEKRKSLLLLSVIALTIALLSACNQNQTKKVTESGTKYYRNILFSETPWDIEKGSRELTPEEAAGINIYKTVYYDQDNEYAGGKMVPVTQYTYDKHGALIETKNMDKDRNIINSPENGVAITGYKYDDKGNRTETLRYDKDRVAVNI